MYIIQTHGWGTGEQGTQLLTLLCDILVLG